MNQDIITQEQALLLGTKVHEEYIDNLKKIRDYVRDLRVDMDRAVLRLEQAMMDSHLRGTMTALRDDMVLRRMLEECGGYNNYRKNR